MDKFIIITSMSCIDKSWSKEIVGLKAKQFGHMKILKQN